MSWSVYIIHLIIVLIYCITGKTAPFKGRIPNKDQPVQQVPREWIILWMGRAWKLHAERLWPGFKPRTFLLWSKPVHPEVPYLTFGMVFSSMRPYHLFSWNVTIVIIVTNFTKAWLTLCVFGRCKGLLHVTVWPLERCDTVWTKISVSQTALHLTLAGHTSEAYVVEKHTLIKA